MKLVKIISALLALLFILTAFPLSALAEGEENGDGAVLTTGEYGEGEDSGTDGDEPILTVGAEGEDGEDGDEPVTTVGAEGEDGDEPVTTVGAEDEDSETDGEDAESAEDGETAEGEQTDPNKEVDYMVDAFENRQDKLDTMEIVCEQDGYRIWYEETSGEVAIEQISTGAVMFSNPYDISSKNSKITNEVKKQLLSQIKLTYLNNEKEEEMYSYVEAALRDQIHLKHIRNGIRVEYVLGEDAVQRLVPRMISTERFEKFIAGPLREAVEEGVPGADFVQHKLSGFFSKKDLSEAKNDKEVRDMTAAFPIVRQMAVWVCDTSITAPRLKELEGYIKTYCPKYTYEELETDNEETGYVNTDAAPPRFTMALEYTLSEDGFQVRLPANGISFDEEAYPLKTISILPFMGAGNSNYTGYTFIPDGSGAIIRYEDIKDTIWTVSGQMYGPDYAYHEVESGNEQVMRLPIFGAVTDYSNPTGDKKEEMAKYDDMGFIAIITEGDSMATLTSQHGGTLYCYNHVYATFTPRPSDSYNLADSISVSGSSTWTVTSERRYTGSYTIKFVMLTGDGENGGYEPSYIGMAEAYRDYLYDTGTLEKLEADGDIPLFIESFGSTKTTKRIVSIPVTVDAPLTTFENVETIADSLREAGVTNLNFKLRGFANGGLVSTMPYKLKWVDALGGNKGFSELVDYAKENDIGIYPDFDFAYLYVKDAFDGVNLKKVAVKTIDDRYTRKKEYDPAYQALMENKEMSMIAISPSSFDYFYSKFTKNYSGYENGAISLSSLGSDLNSDFNKDDPYHREDAKEVTAELLARAKEDYGSVMVSGGNAFTYSSADIITDVALTSSQYIYASESIPFIGMVLHGAKVFMSEPLNMEGDINEALLRAIENGATINFTLSYQNTDKLKDSRYWRQYYSVAYDIWHDDVIKYYGVLNDALKDVQTSLIVGHDFLDAKRIPDEDELEADKLELERLKAEAEEKAKAEEEKNAKIARRNARLGINKEIVPSNTGVEVKIDESKYDTARGTVVMVKYENGTTFLLNYNSFDITVEYEGTQYTIGAVSFVKLG